MAKMTVEYEANPYRVNFMTNHPTTGEILMPGDVVVIPDELITSRQRADGLFEPAPESMLNRVPRESGDRIGITISAEEYEARERSRTPGGKVPDAALEQMQGVRQPV